MKQETPEKWGFPVAFPVLPGWVFGVPGPYIERDSEPLSI
jgi:hypothetical protein